MVTQGTVDEDIYKIQNRKMEMNEAIMEEGGGKQKKKSNNEEMARLANAAVERFLKSPVRPSSSPATETKAIEIDKDAKADPSVPESLGKDEVSAKPEASSIAKDSGDDDSKAEGDTNKASAKPEPSSMAADSDDSSKPDVADSSDGNKPEADSKATDSRDGCKDDKDIAAPNAETAVRDEKKQAKATKPRHAWSDSSSESDDEADLEDMRRRIAERNKMKK